MPQKKTHPLTCQQCGATFLVQPRYADKAQFCSTACKGESQKRTGVVTPEDIDRIWSKIDQSGGPSSCWPWLGATDTRGYGKIGWVDGRNRTVNRVIAELALGRSIPSSEHACHTCDNPPCCNPSHVFFGSRDDNMDDCRRKGRTLAGTRNHQSILTESDVAEIRNTYRPRDPEFGGTALARKFGVSNSTVGYIVRGLKWKHLLPSS